VSRSDWELLVVIGSEQELVRMSRSVQELAVVSGS
jgi:hypothetical protein